MHLLTCRENNVFFVFSLVSIFSNKRKYKKKQKKNGNTEKMKYENEIRGQNTKVEIGLRWLKATHSQEI